MPFQHRLSTVGRTGSRHEDWAHAMCSMLDVPSKPIGRTSRTLLCDRPRYDNGFRSAIGPQTDQRNSSAELTKVGVSLAYAEEKHKPNVPGHRMLWVPVSLTSVLATTGILPQVRLQQFLHISLSTDRAVDRSYAQRVWATDSINNKPEERNPINSSYSEVSKLCLKMRLQDGRMQWKLQHFFVYQ
jgi:hypothetical protein